MFVLKEVHVSFSTINTLEAVPWFHYFLKFDAVFFLKNPQPGPGGNRLTGEWQYGSFWEKAETFALAKFVKGLQALLGDT